MSEMQNILVTGAVGLIGSELTMELRHRYGNENVVATGHRTKPSEKLRQSGPFEFVTPVITHRIPLDDFERYFKLMTTRPKMSGGSAFPVSGELNHDFKRYI